MATVSIRIDDTLKRDTENIFSELGLSVATATTLFYKQVVNCGGIPFELKTKIPNEKTLEAIKESRKMAAEGTARNFTSLAQMFEVMDEENEKDDE